MKQLLPYTAPSMEIIDLLAEDIITQSGDNLMSIYETPLDSTATSYSVNP